MCERFGYKYYNFLQDKWHTNVSECYMESLTGRRGKLKAKNCNRGHNCFDLVGSRLHGVACNEIIADRLIIPTKCRW